MRHRLLPLIAGLALAVLTALPAPLAADPAAAALVRGERLVLAGDYRAARAVLAPLAPADPALRQRRDWALAMSHMRENAPRAALPHLERLVSAAPGAVRYRLELGHALALMGEDERARLHFHQSLGAPLTAPERRAVERYLDRLDARKTWEARLGFALVPESNAARRTGAETVDIGGLTFLLNPNARSAPGTGLQITGGVTWLPRIGAGTRGRLSLAASARLFEDSKLNEIILRAEAGTLWPGDRGRQAGVGVNLLATWAGGRPFSRGAGVHALWSGRLGQATQLTLRADADRLKHPTFAARDGTQIAAGVRLSRAVGPRLTLRGGVHARAIRARSAAERGLDAGITLGAQYAFDGGLVVAADITAESRRRDGVAPLFGVARDDTRTIVAARLLHRELRVRGYTPVLELGHERQRSNIVLYDYRNTRLSLGLTRAF